MLSSDQQHVTTCTRCIENADANCIECSNLIEIKKKNALIDNDDLIKTLIDTSFTQLTIDIRSNFKNTFNNLKNHMESIQDCISANIEYIKDEITIRIESIKIQLDELNDKLKEELDGAKTDLFNKTNLVEINELENSLVKVDDDHLNLLTSDKIFDQLKLMNDAINELKSFKHEVTLELSNLKVDQSLVGEIKYLYKNESLVSDINKRAKSGVYKTIDLNAFDICVTSTDNNFITTNFNDSNICLYDKNFKLIKQVNRLNNLSFKPYSVTSNIDENKVYICDHSNNRIFMIDSELNYKSVFGGKCGKQNEQFDCPLGIDYFKNFVFICDSRNKRIQKLTNNLTFSSSYTLSYLPWQIKIGDSLACVRDLLYSNIYFHDVNTFQIKLNYSGHNGSISMVNSYFYEYYYQNKTLYCYDQNGKLHEEIQMNSLNSTQFHSWSSIALIDNQFVWTSQPSKKLIIF